MLVRMKTVAAAAAAMTGTALDEPLQPAMKSVGILDVESSCQ